MRRGSASVASGVETSDLAMAQTPQPDPRWIFDALPPSGTRRGGDPSEHAFRHDLATFVREVVQNANDQAVGAPRVSLDLHEVSGPAFEAFRKAVAWDTLEPHLRGAHSTRAGARVVEHLDRVLEKDRILLLRVSDHNTVGLTGEESEGESHFRALCKDTLFSHKQSESAGGSYGLGKSVLWAFSGLSTVLFASRLQEDPKGFTSPRVIGRTELPSHAVDGEGFTGSGWFGRVVDLEHGFLRAESLWGRAAAALAENLHLDRDETSGTSILILGFRDPTADVRGTVDAMQKAIRAAAARNFWPAMELATRGLKVDVGGAAVRPAEISNASPFVECWRGRHRAVDVLEAPGDVVVRSISIDLPKRRDTGKAVTGRVDLIVKLADDGHNDANTGEVAMFRGAGMVVRYWDQSALARSLRPFHAVVACGTGRCEEPDVTDDAIERFLRAAEPPGHDHWHSTPALRDSFQRGYLKALKRLESDIVHQLREALAPSVSRGIQGPDRLRVRFPIGKSGGEGGGPSAFLFERLHAKFDGARWSFHGALKPSVASRPWRARIRLHEVSEDGRSLDPVAIERLDTDEGVKVSIADGVAELEADSGIDRVGFEGSSAYQAVTSTQAPELGLEVLGQLKEEEVSR